MRDFGDGFVAVLLPVYLTALGFSAIEVGVTATVALLGSSMPTLAVGAFGGRHDPRRLLTASVGTISPSAGSVSVFAPLEQTTQSAAADNRAHTAMFARYSLVGALSKAVGVLAAATSDYLAPFGLERREAIRAMFVVHAGPGLVGGCCRSASGT